MLTWTKSGISLDPDWSWSVGNWYQKSLYVSLVKTEKTEKLLSFLSIFLKFETSSLTFAPMIVSFSTYFWLKLSFEKSSTSVEVKTLKTRFLVKMPTVFLEYKRFQFIFKWPQKVWGRRILHVLGVLGNFIGTPVKFNLVEMIGPNVASQQPIIS